VRLISSPKSGAFGSRAIARPTWKRFYGAIDKYKTSDFHVPMAPLETMVDTMLTDLNIEAPVSFIVQVVEQIQMNMNHYLRSAVCHAYWESKGIKSTIKAPDGLLTNLQGSLTTILDKYRESGKDIPFTDEHKEELVNHVRVVARKKLAELLAA